MNKKQWKVEELENSVVSYPLNDIIEHNLCSYCECNPRIENHKKKLIMHNAMDGREKVKN